VPEFDIFFQPSLWEAMSIAVLEAMAAGVPVVASRVGENPHIIEHGKDGLLIEPRDVEGMASALTTLVDDASLRRELGAAARDKVSRQYTVSHMTRAYEQIYREEARS
jgi:glycosyltransferase involved in cell wall biosynthesis